MAPSPAIVVPSFLAIVRAAVAFNPLDAAEFFFFWYGSAGMPVYWVVLWGLKLKVNIRKSYTMRRPEPVQVREE